MATTLQNGHANGANGAADVTYTSKRFSDVPSVLDIPVQDQDDEAVEIDLTNLMDDPSDLCDLFEAERAARTYWMAVALAYAKQNKVDYAIETLLRGNALQTINQREKLSMISCLCWMYLWKSREAPRIAPTGQPDAKTKEHYLQLATVTLNEASRISPNFSPLFLARGVLYLLRASLQQPSKSGGAGVLDPEKAELLQSALKSFEDAIRVSSGRNMLAVMGKARALFSMGKYPEALLAYQQVLTKMPDMVDPDPRIGIGCCFWQLGFKPDAKIAWERALEISPESKVANILLGLYWIDSSGHVPTGSAEFTRRYTKAISEYTQRAFKLDKEFPLTCATFAGYFASRGNVENVDRLAHKAIQYTDVNAIASDGWYLLARQEHRAGDLESANRHYQRADDARGGDQRGYLPAKFGQAQLLVLKNDLPGARYHLEKMKDKHARNHETMTLLGQSLFSRLQTPRCILLTFGKGQFTPRKSSPMTSLRSRRIRATKPEMPFSYWNPFGLVGKTLRKTSLRTRQSFSTSPGYTRTNNRTRHFNVCNRLSRWSLINLIHLRYHLTSQTRLRRRPPCGGYCLPSS